MANALVELEAQFPFNLAPALGRAAGGRRPERRAVRHRRGRCTSACRRTRKLLGYWDIVADRLFKIRNSENIQGVSQQLPLFDPPMDPGMLVQAAAAGLDIGSIVSGLNQPIGPVRSPLLIQKALELAARGALARRRAARGTGEGRRRAARPAAAGTRDAAAAAHPERPLPAVAARAGARPTGLLQRRAGQRWSGTRTTCGCSDLTPDPHGRPATTFDARPRASSPKTTSPTPTARWSGKYDLTDRAAGVLRPLQLAQGGSPSTQSGATGQGQMYLNKNEDSELNKHLPTARDTRLSANIANSIAAGLFPIPTRTSTCILGDRRRTPTVLRRQPRRHREARRPTSCSMHRRLRAGPGGHRVAHRRLPAPGR